MIVCEVILLAALVSNLCYLFHRDILYHTDIARDLMILEEMVDEHKLSLIGARSSIPGVFHGPAWYYLNLPVFYFSDGNPIATGWFWLFLSVSAAVAFYCLSAKILGKKAALLATTLVISLKMALPIGLGQQSGAFFLIFVYFYFVWRYLQQRRWWQLVLAMLTVGMIIQFQMAFGGPMLILTGVYLIYEIFKSKKYGHLGCLVALLIPLSTFIFFDYRHDFLQTRSVWRYFTSGENGGENFSIWAYLQQRWWAVTDCFKLIKSEQRWIMIGTSVLTWASLIYSKWQIKHESKSVQSAWRLSVIMIIGFWLVTLPFKGSIWWFYYESLLPPLAIWVAYAVVKLRYWWWYFLLIMMMSVSVITEWKWNEFYFSGGATDHEFYWSFYQHLVADIQKNAAGSDYSYYVFTMDRYGYQAKYALSYALKKEHMEKHVHEKLPVTYLVIGRNDWGDDYVQAWKIGDVKIEREADEKWEYNSGYKVERYNLTEEERQVKSNPNLIKGLEMR